MNLVYILSTHFPNSYIKIIINIYALFFQVAIHFRFKTNSILPIAGLSGRAVLRRRSAAARLLGLWVRIQPGAWMSVSCECCMLSGRGLCDGVIIRPEESYRLWCVVECDLEISRMRRLWSTGGCCAKTNVFFLVYN